MFINITHPSQIRDKKVQKTVRAFSSLQHQRRRKGDRTQETLGNSKKCQDYPRLSEDPNIARAGSSTPSIPISEYGHDSNNDLPRSDAEEDQNGEEIGGPPRSTDHSLILFTDRKSKTPVEHKLDEILELFPAGGNITPPYSEIDLSPQKAARLRRLTQFYIEVDGPTSIWRPQQLLESSNALIFKRNFFSMSMTEPIIMEAVFAGSQLRLDHGHDRHNEPSALVFQHRGKVMKMIEERIRNPTKMLDDVTFFAIMAMITLDCLLGNWASFKCNLDGFRMLVVLRGGIENLGWQGWFQTHLGWTEYQWATHQAKKELNNLVAPSYPRHPFLPALSVSVSKLPEGLIEAALLRNLSNEMLDLLFEVNSWTACYDQRPRNYYLEGFRLISNAAELMGKYAISRAERIFCIATIAYVIETDGRTGETRTPRGLEDHLLGIQGLHSGLELDDALLWAAVVIAASNDNPQIPSVNKWKILDRMMDTDLSRERGDWDGSKGRLRKFFWNASIEKSWAICWNVASDRRKERVSSKEKASKLSRTRVTPPVYDFDTNWTHRSKPESEQQCAP